MSESPQRKPQHLGAHIGMVKWFNHRLGYGFITVKLDNEDNDLFVHQSNIYPTKSTYRTLSKGEYVSLNISESDDTRQAIDVTGVNGGPLMCDHSNMSRRSNRDDSESNEEYDIPKPRRRVNRNSEEVSN